jgi:hypothetical protein
MWRSLEHHQLPFGKGKKLEGYVALVKYKYRSGDAAGNSMFIVTEAGVFWVCKQQHMCIIRLIRDPRVGIPWIGVGAVRKAAFMLVREVSIREDMVNNRFRLEAESILDSRELSRDLNERYS